MRINALRKGQSISASSPAKINLFLDVLGKRPDGYHEVSTVMCAVDLWDDLEIEVRQDGKIELLLNLPDDIADTNSVAQDPAWQIPNDSNNLVYRAAMAVQRQLGTKLGCTIKLTKRIPAAAGLGGGSGNAAAAIIGCQKLWADWNRQQADQICQQLGSDLNFFLGSPEGFGMMHATGRGECVRLLAQQTKMAFWLTHPPQGCSTKEVYSRLRQIGSLSKTEEFLTTCQTGQESKIGAAMFNALQLPASEVNDWIESQLQLLNKCGCEHTLMSGSGSSCFGMVPRDGSIEFLRSQANRLGIRRVYQVAAWFGQSIERQLDLCESR